MGVFRQGHAYAAAIDWPWYVPEGAAVEAVESEGWKVVEVAPCGDRDRAVPVKPPPGCDVDYDTIAVAIRTGPDYARELPPEFVWVQDVASDQPPERNEPASREPLAFWTGALLGFAGGAGSVALGVLALSLWRKR